MPRFRSSPARTSSSKLSKRFTHAVGAGADILVPQTWQSLSQFVTLGDPVGAACEPLSLECFSNGENFGDR